MGQQIYSWVLFDRMGFNFRVPIEDYKVFNGWILKAELVQSEMGVIVWASLRLGDINCGELFCMRFLECLPSGFHWT